MCMKCVWTKSNIKLLWNPRHINVLFLLKCILNIGTDDEPLTGQSTIPEYFKPIKHATWVDIVLVKALDWIA